MLRGDREVIRGRFCASWGSLLLLILVALPAFAGEEMPDAASPGARPACAAGAAEATARLVQSRYDGIRDLRADFEQVTRSASFAGEPLMDSAPRTGRVIFAKPGRMRWTYAAPGASVVVSDGRSLWIHDVEGATATRLEVTEGSLSGAALEFLLGEGNILEEFDVRATDCGAERVSLDLVPKRDASYERLGLVARTTTGDIEETSIVDLFGNHTEIRFHEIEVNRSPAADLFEFEVPEGVEFIDYAGSQAG